MPTFVNKINIQIDFNVGQKVKIKELGLTGIVKSVWITASGTQYQIRYLWEYKAEEVYFFADELEYIR